MWHHQPQPNFRRSGLSWAKVISNWCVLCLSHRYESLVVLMVEAWKPVHMLHRTFTLSKCDCDG